MSKKTFYIILITLSGIIIIGGIIWYFALKPENAPAPAAGADFTVPGQTANKTDIEVISEEPVISLYRNDRDILFYGFSGKLWKINENELKPVLLDEKPVENLAEIIWPKVFSSDGKKIVYQKNNGLFTSDSSGKNQKTLVSDLKLKDVILKWPTINNIALISKPSGLMAGGLWFLDVRNLGIKKIISNFGFEILFAPDGGSFVYSYTDQNGKNPVLSVYDKRGDQKIISNVSTLVDKCAWTKDLINIYCAIPKLWPDFAVLPDDYYKNAFSTSDDIWKINTETGGKMLVLKYIGGISNMIITDDEKSIFFISKENKFLYKLDNKVKQ
ncbi:MAG: hypothetical protein HYV51_00725 [Parcubacteria group bacterium]|nr:hypothetical protein [Parcubacteria group bacterium]